jgi:hypothetical protein
MLLERNRGLAVKVHGEQEETERTSATNVRRLWNSTDTVKAPSCMKRPRMRTVRPVFNLLMSTSLPKMMPEPIPCVAIARTSNPTNTGVMNEGRMIEYPEPTYTIL